MKKTLFLGFAALMLGLLSTACIDPIVSDIAEDNEKPAAKPAQNAAQNPSPAPAQNAQPKNVQPKQQAPQAKPPEKKTDDSITREQQSALFHAAKGKNDIVKEVLMNHAYVSTAEIKTWDYEGILKEITEKAS